MDILTPEQRHRNMSAIRSKDTKPEIAVRSILHNMGYRFRLHRKDLPGTPDIVLPRHMTVVMVYGCFWHRHPKCRCATVPATRPEFWAKKFQQNVERDKRSEKALRAMGWKVIRIWECEIKDMKRLTSRLKRLLVNTASAHEEQQ